MLILPELKHSTLAFMFVGSNALSLFWLPPLKHNGFTSVTYLEGYFDWPGVVPAILSPLMRCYGTSDDDS